ncbi:Uncharacterised protein [Mycobacterium xenopi]|nr:Uncharacterised protein [Mycobacterium xenopi]
MEPLTACTSVSEQISPRRRAGRNVGATGPPSGSNAYALCALTATLTGPAPAPSTRFAHVACGTRRAVPRLRLGHVLSQRNRASPTMGCNGSRCRPRRVDPLLRRAAPRVPLRSMILRGSARGPPRTQSMWSRLPSWAIMHRPLASGPCARTSFRVRRETGGSAAASQSAWPGLLQGSSSVIAARIARRPAGDPVSHITLRRRHRRNGLQQTHENP